MGWFFFFASFSPSLHKVYNNSTRDYLKLLQIFSFHSHAFAHAHSFLSHTRVQFFFFFLFCFRLFNGLTVAYYCNNNIQLIVPTSTRKTWIEKYNDRVSNNCDYSILQSTSWTLSPSLPFVANLRLSVHASYTQAGKKVRVRLFVHVTLYVYLKRKLR